MAKPTDEAVADKRQNLVMSASGVEFGASAVNLNLAHGSPTPVDASRAHAIANGHEPPMFGDAMGNVWEWCDDDFQPLPGFEVHPYCTHAARRS